MVKLSVDDIAKKLAAMEFVKPEDDDSIFSGLVAIGVRPSEWHADLDRLRELIVAHRDLAAFRADYSGPTYTYDEIAL